MVLLNIGLNDLTEAGNKLVYGGNLMVQNNVPRPQDLATGVTGIGGEITRFLLGLQVARAALADAAKTTHGGIRELCGELTSLDKEFAGVLAKGFALRGDEK